MKEKITIILFLCLISVAGYGQKNTSTNILIDTTIKKKPTAIRIVDVNFEMERTRKKLVKIAYELKPDPRLILLDTFLVKQKVFLMNELKEFKQFNPHNLSKYFLENTYRAWSGYKAKLVKSKTFINSHISHIQNHIDNLEFSKSTWKLTLDKVKDANAPIQLSARIEDLIQEIADMELKFYNIRRDMIIEEDKISDLIGITDDVEEEVSQLQQHLRDNLFVADKPNLWKIKLSTSDIIPLAPRLHKAWHENAKTVIIFSREINYFYLALAILLFTFLFWYVIAQYRKLEMTEADPNFVSIKRIFFNYPYSSITFILIIFLLVSYTNMPLILIGILGIVLLLIAIRFLPKIIGPQGKNLVKTALILYLFNLFEIVFWYFGTFARLYVAAESIIALYLIYRYGVAEFLKRNNDSRVHPFIKMFRALSLFLFVLFSIALFSNLFGFMNLAVLTLKTGVKTLAIVVIIFSAYAILHAFLLALAEIGKKGHYLLMENKWEKFEKRSIQLLNLLAILFLIKFMLQTMEIYRPVMDWLIGFLAHNWTIGTMHISIGGILSLVIILTITFGFSSLLKVLIEDKFLAHSKLPKGVPAAISVTIRYFVITLGILMALGAAGIDLGKFGLLAGALGVGIGFGLQNIVNNFISGLILVYERPVNLGDTIEVENLMGTVNRIGIRSSNVRTYDGAEVVVPNGNLISNQLINWTLSDNKRRIEIKVGAAYGSDPNVILNLLKSVALEHEDILKNPEPRALFEEFGDSSLNFRLLFWVPFEKGIGVKSDIAIAVYNIFKENNIEIPFPQVDLHVKEEKGEQEKNSSERSNT